LVANFLVIFMVKGEQINYYQREISDFFGSFSIFIGFWLKNCRL